MEAILMKRPDASEAPSYAHKYIDLVSGNDPLAALRAQVKDTVELLESWGDGRAASVRYEPGKWTPKEVLAHIVDCERVFQYRLLRIARGDTTPLAGFDEKIFAHNAAANERPLEDLIAEYRIVRQSTIALLTPLSAEAWERRGQASGHAISVRALAFLTAGHELHHLKILRERY